MRPPRTLRTSSAVSVAVSAAFVVAFSPWSVAAQDATQAFGDVVDVRVVNLEVVVTDDDGRVSGLAPEDFVLEVDGRPVPLEFFTEVRDGTAVARDQSTAAALPALEPGQLVGTSYLLFIDEYFSIAQDRDQVLDGLINQLTGLRVTDRMAVVAYTGEDVEMLQNWTDNVPRLVESLRRAKRRDTYGLQWRTEGLLFEPTNEESGQRADPLTGEIDEPSGRDSVFEARLEEKIYARRVEDQVSRAVAAATATLRGFASPPGRKIMLLLSGGWPDDPGAWVLQDTSEFLDNAGILTGDDLLGPLASKANRLGFTIYPIDVPGLRTIGIDAESATLDTPNSAIIGPEDGSAPSFGNQTGRRQEQEEHFALLALAQSTGGEAYLNQSRLGALEQVVADTRSYYWLGFTPTWRGDDSEHRVDVRLNRPGLTVRARRGFVDLSRENEVTMMTESALLFGDLPAAYPLEVKVGEGRRAGWGKREVPVAVKIPADVITFLPSAEGYVTELELRVAVIDENEERAEVPMVPMVLRTQRLPEEGEFHVHHTVLKMRKGEHQVVVSLYDRFSGKILTARLAVPAA
ncbi:MAG: VWA domain-containing protein [Acidobacteriota bacterium]